jgi:hypothetical protein
MFMFVPEMQPHVESFWPSSVIGWLTTGTLAITVAKTGFDWWTGKRKSLTALQGSIHGVEVKMEKVCEKIDDMEGRFEVVDGLSHSISELVYEWRGIDGTNGYKSIIKRHDQELIEVRRRNDRIDAVTEDKLRRVHDEDLRRSGGIERRYSDRELNNLMPEEREDKG